MEALYEELSLSPERRGRDLVNVTLEDYVASMLDHSRQVDRERRNEREYAAASVTWAMGFLAVLSFLFLAIGTQNEGDWAWLNRNRFNLWLSGLGLSAVFVGISIERSSFFRHLWSFWFTKIVASLGVSGLVIFSTGKAASLINGIFPVDAAALPLTRAIVASFITFQYAYPLLIALTIIFTILHGIDAAGWIKQKLTNAHAYSLPPLLSIAFLVISLILLLSFTRLTNYDFSEGSWPTKVYRLAHALDFNAKYSCNNLKKDLRVVFLGPDHSRVLVDLNSIQTDTLESFVKGGPIHLPERFFVLSCDTSGK